MAFLGFGAEQKIEPVGVGLKLASLASSTGATMAATGTGLATGGTVLGLTSLAWSGVGAALAAIYVAYSMITNHQKVVKAKRKAREARWQALYDIGTNLIYEVYRVGIPGWSHLRSSDTGFGEYFMLGRHFWVWSSRGSGVQKKELKLDKQGLSQKDIDKINKDIEKAQKGEEDIRAILAKWIKDKGLDPTRFIGSANVREEEELKLMSDFVAEPERALVSKEALEAFGYSQSQIDSLSQPYLVRLFDMINTMGRVNTEEKAKLVKKDIESHLTIGGLDPSKFFGTPAPLPSPINSSSQVLEAPTTIQPIEIAKAELSPLLIIGLLAGGLLMFSRKKKKRGGY